MGSTRRPARPEDCVPNLVRCVSRHAWCWSTGYTYTYLLVCLVLTHGLAAVHVGVDAGVKLVGHVAGVRASSVACRSGAGAVQPVGTGGSTVGASHARATKGISGVGATKGIAGAAQTACGAGAVTVGIDTRVGSVGDTRVVRASGTLRHAGAAHAHGVASSAGVATAIGVGAGVAAHRARTITVRVDAGVGCVGHARAVRASGTLGHAGAAHCAASHRVSYTGAAILAMAGGLAHASVAGVIHVRVDTGIGSVGGAGAVRAGGAFRSGALVAVESVLDLVDDVRHDGGCCVGLL